MNLNHDCYYIKAVGKSSEFLKTFLVANNGTWRWQGVLHESLVSSNPGSRELFSAATLLYDETSGNRAQNPEKYLEDARVLEKALVKEPDHPRYTFYLAQSYLHAGNFLEALACYEKRVQLKGDAEEIFWSYYCIGCLQKDLQYPSSEIIKAFCTAFQYKPNQAEPLYRLASHLSNHPFLAYLLTRYAKEIPIPPSAARLQAWIYEALPKECEKYESLALPKK